MFDVETLNKFYADLSANDGISVTDFQNKLETLFAMSRSKDDVNDYRLGKNPWKKLSDEIMPVSRFLKFKDIEIGRRIRFLLDDSAPDCWLLNDHGDDFGIEVTIAGRREDYYLMEELNQTGRAPGFIGMPDNAPQNEFVDRMSNPRTAYTSQQILEAKENAILCRLSEKNKPKKYKGVSCLLIGVYFVGLPEESWDAIKQKLSREAINLPFQEAHIIVGADTKLCGFQIK
jgi:hypothetical protein